MCSYHTNFSNFIATLYLKKTNFLGIQKTISIIVTPTLKVVKIESKTDIPLKKGEYIDIENFSKWVVDNNYSLNFFTKNSKFKRDLYFHFDDIILNNKMRKKNIFNKIITYLKSLISFRIFIKI